MCEAYKWGMLFLAHKAHILCNQIFSDRKLGEYFVVCGIYFFYYTKIKGKSYWLSWTPISGFLSYLPNSKSTVYSFLRRINEFELVKNSVGQQFGLSELFTKVNVDVKY